MMHFGTREFSVPELHAKFGEYMENQENVDRAATYIYDSLVEDLTMGVLFEFHHGMKTGLTELLEGEPEKEEPLLIVSAPECDVFGLSVVKKTPDCNCSCPNCDRPVSATRFAPHLEKCMGMGRNSSRIASRRIASNSKEPAMYTGLLSDDDDDADWVGDRRKKKLRNNGVKKQTKINGTAKASSTNGVSSESTSTSTQESGGATYETMTWNEKKNLLVQICGVVSEHTKKLCTRSTRCPQHTEEQRKTLRSTVLDPSLEHAASSSSAETPPLPPPLTPHDVGSPPDSSPSSSCSSSSRKRDKHRSKNSKAKREKLNHSPGKE